jgi:PAS domain S-box-containing protein
MPFTQNGIVMVDLQGRITFANNFFCDLMGITSDKVRGFLWFEFVFPEDLPRVQALFEANKLSSPEPFTFKLKHGTTGSPVQVHIQGTPLKMATGLVYGIVATITPVDRITNSQVGID